jgi:hypothetical protein
MYVYRNGVRIGRSTVRTGAKGHPTPTGIFTIIQKEVDHESTLYKGAKMPHMQRLTWDGIAMHAGKLPGYPASHGCVRLSEDFAEKLYSVTKNGTTVIVTDQQYAPGKTASPGLLLSGQTGEAPSRHLPTGGFEWYPDKSPDGAVSIIFSMQDSIAYVYRNGVQIGRTAFVLDKKMDISGSHVYSALTVADSRGARDWIAVTSIGGGESPDVKALAGFAKIPSKFLENVRAEISQTSFVGGWKVGVLVGADRLNDASANAFLKTLEEPPDKTLFLLLTDAPQQLLPTIISRCQRIDLDAFRELSEPWLGTCVSTLSSSYYKTPIERMVMSSQLSKLLEEMKEKAETCVKEEANADTNVEVDDDVFNAKVSARYREMRMDFLVTFMRWYRDLFMFKSGGGELIHFKDKADLLKERAERLTLAQTLYNLNAVEELARHFDRNLNEESVLAYAVDRIFHGVGDKA